MHLLSNRVTIKEVASAAGVSTQTVSRVINNRPDVSFDTRKRVQEIIEELDYRPSALARSLIQQRSYTLGVVTAGLKFIGPSRTLNGITTAAETQGYSLLLKELPHFQTNTITPIIDALLARHVDGIIWAVPEIGNNHDWVNEQVLDSKIPLVFLTMEPRENSSNICIDNYQGGRMAMAHLIEQGYRHIAHLSGPLDWWEARQRKAAWTDALVEAGREARDENWAEGNWSSASAILPFEKILERYPQMDAIFVANDQMALSVLYVAHQRGLRIPDDFGVVGFDNFPESPFFFPPLTTIQQDQYNQAKLAVEEVIRIIESGWDGQDPGEPQTIILPPTLVIRQSSLRNKG